MSDLLAQMAIRASLIALVVNIGIALYGIFSRPSLVKKFICLIMFTDSLNLFAVFIGFRLLSRTYPSPPVRGRAPLGESELEELVETTVDPLPQALVITAIVIGLATSMFILGLILMYYEHYKTTSIIVQRGEVEIVE